MAEALILLVLVAAAAVLYRSRRGRKQPPYSPYDGLTGLPGRALFLDRLERMVDPGRRRQGNRFAVLCLDLDRFKVVNDSLGHGAGDRLLAEAASRLVPLVGTQDMLARLGGDEFAIVLDPLKEPVDATRLAEAIQSALGQPFELDGQEVFVTASIGIALADSGYPSAEAVLRDADIAMYRAKARRPGMHEVFDPAMHREALELMRLESDLRQAVEHDELVLHYQPVISLETGELAGFEALVRWNHPRLGLLAPSRFIPLAEETGLIVPIGRWVLAEACRAFRAWRQGVPSDHALTLGVNLSGRQLVREELLPALDAALQESRLDAGALELEITESAVMADPEGATGLLGDVKQRGVRIAIDDFGTGYSSLGYLHRFPIDTLKIDRSFISRMGDQANDLELIGTIILLAQKTGMNTIAEGVETSDQLTALRMLGCRHGQGFFLSPPVPPPAAHALLDGPHSWDAALAGD